MLNHCCFGVAQCHPNTTMVSVLPIVSKLSFVLLINFHSCDIIMAIAGAERERESNSSSSSSSNVNVRYSSSINVRYNLMIKEE